MATLTTTEAARTATGRTYDEWNRLLDAWGAAARKHGEIVAWLRNEHQVGNWWAQTITVEYERARGLRAAGGGRDGKFTISAGKMIDVEVDSLFAAFTDPKRRERWLDGELRERTSQPGRTARFDWADGTTRVNVGFTGKGGRSQVALAHERIADAETAEKLRIYWRERLIALKALLESIHAPATTLN